MKNVFFMAALCLFGSICKTNAQEQTKKNNIQFQAERFYITKFFENSGFENLPPVYLGTGGLSYQRTFNRHWSVRIGYNGLWKSDRSKWISTEEAPFYKRDTIERLTSRRGWKFADLEAEYYKSFKRHKFSIGAGLSYSQTNNSYLERQSIKGPDGQYRRENTYFRKTESYWGAVFGLHYDYRFWNNRISAGADFKIRVYNNVPHPYDVYGLHVGYNF